MTLLVGLGLLFLAGQLMRGKRRAWQIASSLFAVGVVTNILKGPHPISAAYCAGMVVALVSIPARVPRRGRPAVAVAAGAAGPGLRRPRAAVRLRQPDRSSAPSRRAADLLRRPADDRRGPGRHRHGPYTYERRVLRARSSRRRCCCSASSACSACAVPAVPAAAGARRRTPSGLGPRPRLVRGYGSDTLAYFALRDDKSFFFSSDGQVLIAYTYLGGFALVSGDPIGPTVLDRPRAGRVHHLLRRPVVAHCVPGRARFRGAALRRRAGLRSFYLGDEAIVECDTLHPRRAGHEGRARRPSAGSRRRYHFQLMRESRGAARRWSAQLNAISEQWRGKAPERGFTMSLSQDIEGGGRNPEFLLCVALDEDGRAGRVPADRARPTAPTSATPST